MEALNSSRGGGRSRNRRGGGRARNRRGGAADRRNVEQARLQEMRERKEVGHFLMPDAPPNKKRSTVSPLRVPCPLVPGTPEVPPPHIPQAWELKKKALEVMRDGTGPSRVVLEEDAATPPPSMEQELIFNPPMVVIKTEDVDETLVVDATIELIDFAPSTSFSAERSTLQNCSPGPSTSRPEPSIYESDLEGEILQWERSAGLNPGSDVEDEDAVDGELARRRHAGEFVVEELSSELREVLGYIDTQDDCALRESSQEDFLHFDWSHDPQVFTGEREKFTGPAGPTFPVAGMSPFEIFSKIWDEDIIDLIVRETNRYAANLQSSTLPQFSRLRKWVPITPQELWTFFGILMLQSICPLPVEREYWFPCLPYLKLGKFGDIMSYPRFSVIKRCLHFVDNALCARGIPSKLTKIKPLIDHLTSKFSSLYLPEQEIAIDESLLLWKGRLSFSQLIATKAAQVGIKSYELCESKTGYLWNMIIYTGERERHNVEAKENPAEPVGATSRTVLKLVRPLLNRGHTLVMDNFYNSPLLARTLKAQKTDVMGTLRLTRQFVPENLRHKNKANMQTGEVAFSHTRDMTITVWMDSNVVPLISTYHKVEVGGKEKNGNYRYKPQVVLDYNLYMGGVDKKDQLLQAFPIERVRNLIWYKKLFRRFLNVSIHNAFVLSSKSGSTKMAQRQFRVLLVDEIMQRFRPPRIEPQLRASSHFPAKTNVRKSRCKWCARRKVDTCTAYKCDTCNVNLCIIGCFKDFHISRGLQQ
ncbi:hypothetical protein PYW07_014787 [Mythimna separata]|uniref:PiggyBac transposable element-derived protein domain-containing protein n=1 Tax=Mythimna separata TaxID=271217 RepID=A0AAD7YZF4_MYTSE|nr:hypothetical protein PYW07_014787 [Mythimna separata]